MVPTKYGLGAVGAHLLSAFERERPGFPAYSAVTEAQLQAQAEVEIARMEQQCHELGFDAPAHWAFVREQVRSLLLPRYGAQVRTQQALAAREYGLWRGGDLVSRAAYAALGFVVGVFAVEVPYIPIEVKWFPFVLMLLGPLLPDAVLAWHRRKHERALNGLVADLEAAQRSVDSYRPPSEWEAELIAGQGGISAKSPAGGLRQSTGPDAAGEGAPPPGGQRTH